MTKTFWNIETKQPIVVSDDAHISDYEGFTDSEILPEITREQLEAQFRLLREKVFAATDALVLPDRNPPQELLDFRQFLRDVPNTQPNFAYELNDVSEYGNKLFAQLMREGKL